MHKAPFRRPAYWKRKEGGAVVAQSKKECKEPITIMVPPKLKVNIQRAADGAHLSRSAWVLMLIRDHFMSEARERQ